MAARCPSDLALEQFLLEPDRSGHAGHLGLCARCQDRIARMRREGEHFLRYVYPATVAAVERAAARRPGLDLTRWLAPVPALAAAAAVLLVARPSAPPEDYLGAKGGGDLGLSVFLRGAEVARPARDGEAVPASASVRFKVRAARPCRLWVVSVDGSGQVSRLFPAEGDGGAEVSATGELPGGAVLDGQPGPERILALCAPQPLPYARVEGAVRSAMASGPEGVRSLRSVPGLPAGTGQDSVLLEKKP